MISRLLATFYLPPKDIAFPNRDARSNLRRKVVNAGSCQQEPIVVVRGLDPAAFRPRTVKVRAHPNLHVVVARCDQLSVSGLTRREGPLDAARTSAGKCATESVPLGLQHVIAVCRKPENPSEGLLFWGLLMRAKIIASGIEGAVAQEVHPPWVRLTP